MLNPVNLFSLGRLKGFPLRPNIAPTRDLVAAGMEIHICWQLGAMVLGTFA
jgi:hypothetical protein